MRRLETLIDECVDPILKGAGFRRKRHRWSRKCGEFVNIVDIRRAHSLPPENEDFCMEAGVFVPEFHKAIWGPHLRQTTASVDGSVHGSADNLAKLLGVSPSEQWWSIPTDEDLVHVREEVVRALNEVFLPFFAKHQTISDIHATLVAGLNKWTEPLTKLHLALAKWRLGDVAGAKALIREVYEMGWTRQAQSVAETTGILLSEGGWQPRVLSRRRLET